MGEEDEDGFPTSSWTAPQQDAKNSEKPSSPGQEGGVCSANAGRHRDLREQSSTHRKKDFMIIRKKHDLPFLA